MSREMSTPRNDGLPARRFGCMRTCPIAIGARGPTPSAAPA